MESSPNLYQRIINVMREVKYIQKGEKKVNNQYRFVSHDDVAAKLHEAVVKHGIAVLPSVLPESVRRDGNRVELVLKSTFVNMDAPEERFEVCFVGEGIDPQDKGCGKAMSYAVKYTLLKVFMLETGDDPENDQIDHAPARRAEKPQDAPKPATTTGTTKPVASAQKATSSAEKLTGNARFLQLADFAQKMGDHATAQKFVAGFNDPEKVKTLQGDGLTVAQLSTLKRLGQIRQLWLADKDIDVGQQVETAVKDGGGQWTEPLYGMGMDGIEAVVAALGERVITR